MDAVGADLALYEGDIRKFRATPELLRIGVDDEDVQAECRISAWKALAKWRARPDAPIRGEDELRWMRRAVRNAFISQIRAATCRPRRLDPKDLPQIKAAVYGTHLSGAFGHAAEVSETPEEHHARAMREAAVRRAAETVETSLGAHRYAALLSRVEARAKPPKLEPLRALVPGPSLEDALSAVGSGSSLLPRAARYPNEVSMSSSDEGVSPESLTDVELARIALNNGKDPVFERAALLAVVREINNPTGAKDVDEAFPVCFRDPKQYDPKHEACTRNGGSCDFRGDCRINIGQFLDPKLEARVEALRDAVRVETLKVVVSSAPVVPTPAPVAWTGDPLAASAPPVQVEKKTKAKKVVEPVAAPVEEVPVAASIGECPPPSVGDVYVDGDPRSGGRLVLVEGVKGPKIQVRSVDSGVATLIDAARFNVLGTKGFTLVGVNGPAALDPVPEGKKPSAPPASRKGEKKPPADLSAPVTGVFFSSRRGVIPEGQKGYSTDDRGKRYYRLPQGAAGYARSCPVGTVAEREWKGHVFKVKKLTDEGRNSKWRLVSHDGAPYVKPMEDTLGKITFHITGNTAWSAAKFWNLLPPELDKKSPSFDPNADLSKYAVYGVKGAKS